MNDKAASSLNGFGRFNWRTGAEVNHHRPINNPPFYPGIGNNSVTASELLITLRMPNHNSSAGKISMS